MARNLMLMNKMFLASAAPAAVDTAGKQDFIQNVNYYRFSTDEMQAILWQYNTAARMQSLLQQRANWWNNTISSWFTAYFGGTFNLQTANEFGTIIWEIILNAPFPGKKEDDNTIAWGFGDYNANFAKAYNSGYGANFANNVGSVFFSLQERMLILRLLYAKYTSCCSLTEVTAIMREYIDPNSYIVDNGDMTATIYGGGSLDKNIKTALTTMDVLPRPAGVQYNFADIKPEG